MPEQHPRISLGSQPAVTAQISPEASHHKGGHDGLIVPVAGKEHKWISIGSKRMHHHRCRLGTTAPNGLFSQGKTLQERIPSALQPMGHHQSHWSSDLAAGGHGLATQETGHEHQHWAPAQRTATLPGLIPDPQSRQGTGGGRLINDRFGRRSFRGRGHGVGIPATSS